MAYVVTENCINCRYTDCVAVCPVNCFYEHEQMLAIHPDECIDCGLCVAECPVEAIYDEEDLPPQYEKFKSINLAIAQKNQLITQPQKPLAFAAKWKSIKDKIHHLNIKE